MCSDAHSITLIYRGKVVNLTYGLFNSVFNLLKENGFVGELLRDR